MFAKFAVAISTLAVLATAAPASQIQASQCNTGPVQCCNSVQSAKSDATTAVVSSAGLLTGAITAALQGVTAQVGLHCLDIVGSSCGKAQPVCCQNNQFNGLVNIGCTPISL